MNILLADAFPQPQLERLRAEGHECELTPTLTGDDLPAPFPDSKRSSYAAPGSAR